MPPRLIVNADDFGLTLGINRAIAALHDAGAVTSATLMANGPAFEDAVALARARPTLGVGCHVVLTDGTPVCSPRTIPSLMARDGHSFRPSLGSFLAALLTYQIDPGDIEREAVAQIRRLQQAGVPVTHLDTHKHTHAFPAVTRALLAAARRTGIGAIRNPFETLRNSEPQGPSGEVATNASGTARQPAAISGLRPDKRYLQLSLINLFLRRSFTNQPEIRSGVVRTTNGTLGISATGRLDEAMLRRLVSDVPEGTWELVCHPGFHDHDLERVRTRLRQTRETEQKALLAVLSGSAQARASGSEAHPSRPELIHYGSLPG